MADVIFSDVLRFLNKNLKRYDRSTLLEVISKFYHEDELYDAKCELCKFVTVLQPDTVPPDGWAKYVNNKGAPVARRTNDPGQRRRSEADDLIHMLTLLDVNKIDVPKCVISDPDRIPSTPSCTWNTASCDTPLFTMMSSVQQVVAKFAETMNTVIQRLDGLEAKLSAVQNIQSSTVMQEQPNLCAPVAHMLTEEKLPTSASPEVQPATKSWSDQAKDLRDAAPNLVFSNRRPSVRVRGQAATGSVKGVLRQLTCFVSRLHLDVSEEELTTYLQNQGILDAKCRKMSAKDGRVFRTSAFRVSCSSRYESLFYDEATWPEGAELRDWVFYNNGR